MKQRESKRRAKGRKRKAEAKTQRVKWCLVLPKVKVAVVPSHSGNPVA